MMAGRLFQMSIDDQTMAQHSREIVEHCDRDVQQRSKSICLLSVFIRDDFEGVQGLERCPTSREIHHVKHLSSNQSRFNIELIRTKECYACSVASKVVPADIAQQSRDDAHVEATAS